MPVPGTNLQGRGLIAGPALLLSRLSPRVRHGQAISGGGGDGESALIADSAETMLCALLSLILLIGLLLNAKVGWWWADPVAAIGIAVLAFREGAEAWRGEQHDG